MKLRIHEILAEKGQTPYWLGKTTGITQHNILNLCKNKSTRIGLSTIEKICIALKCTPNDIFVVDYNGTEQDYQGDTD